MTRTEPDNEPCGLESDDEQEVAILDKLTLDGFELLDVQENLGKGSFGVVQKIRRKKSGGGGKIYALKSMRKAEVIDGNLVDQVELEIQVQRGLKHRNVLRLYRHFEDTETVYLLLEFCAKGELYQILRTQKSRRFTQGRACDFFCQASDGLMYLHSHNIVHRDIKPENLLVNKEDVLKIADFGWCAVSSTLRTTFCGTLDYLAPEMIQGKGHDHTLDIWGAGVLLYEMVVGRPPFQSTNHGQLISKILKLELFFPGNIATEPFKDLVRLLLKTEPHERLPLKAALEHPWVLAHIGKTSKDGAAPGPLTPAPSPMLAPRIQQPVALTSPQLRHRQVYAEADSNDLVIRMARPVSEDEPDYEPRPIGSLDGFGIPANVEKPPRIVPEKVTQVVPMATTAPLAMPGTPAMATRGLIASPRVPNVPQHLAQPANVSRPTGVVTTHGMPGAVNPMRVSPTSTPLVMSRQLAKDTQPLQFVTGASSKGVDELSRTWNKPSMSNSIVMEEPAGARHLQPPGTGSSAERRAVSTVRRPGLHTPAQSVVYRPLLPNASPPLHHRTLDPNGPGTASTGHHSETIREGAVRDAPGTPGQQAAFRCRTLSPPADHRLAPEINLSAKTAEAVRRAFPSRGPIEPSAAQRRDGIRHESCEPLHHASSQHALQRGGAQSSAGADYRPGSQMPASPTMKPRRLSAAQPASVSSGIAGTRAVPSMGGMSMTAAGVLASPYPTNNNAFRATHLDQQSLQRSQHNTSLNTSLNPSLANTSVNPSLCDEGQQSARCHPLSEDHADEVPVNRQNRPRSIASSIGSSGYGGMARPQPSQVGSGGGLMRTQAMTTPQGYPGLYGQQQPRLGGLSGGLAPSVNRMPLRYAPSVNRNATFPTR